jgi:uncharacterized protein YggE
MRRTLASSSNTQSAVGNSLTINSTSPFVFDQKVAETDARTLAIAAAKAKAKVMPV